MDILNNKKAKTRKNRLKTICTLQTNDANQVQSSRGKENRIRNSPFRTQNQKSQKKSNIKQTKKKSLSHHFQSQYSAINHSRLQDTASKNLFKRAMSINQGKKIRMKTDYSDNDQTCIRKIMASLKKKLVYPLEQVQPIEPVQILRKFYETKQQQYYQVKRGKKETKCVLIKTKKISTKKQYENQMRIVNSLDNVIKEREQNIFLKIDRVYKSQNEWVIITQNYFYPSWVEDRYYLFLNQFKNNDELLINICRHVVQAILITTFNGYAHGNISLQSLYFPLYKGDLKLRDNIKIGDISHYFEITRKESFLSMPVLYRTPPEILNFIRFDAKQTFDRQSLQYIDCLDEGWKVDVWALGILILQLLNGGVLAGEGCEAGVLINLQKQILIRYSYLLCNVGEAIKMILVKILSINPNQRLHPRQIMKML